MKAVSKAIFLKLGWPSETLGQSLIWLTGAVLQFRVCTPPFGIQWEWRRVIVFLFVLHINPVWKFWVPTIMILPLVRHCVASFIPCLSAAIPVYAHTYTQSHMYT